MTSYSELIESIHLVSEVDTCVTTGDLDYPGTAMEVSEAKGEELFHVVVSAEGEHQLLVFAREQGFRLPLHLLERVLTRAREAVQASE